MSEKYLPTIGIEIHAHLNTETKMFCQCPNHFGDPPNTNVCPICSAMPGTLPVANLSAIQKAILAGLALNCQIAEFTKWDRKQYFYPDLPKGYQISQYDLPLCFNGKIQIKDEKEKLADIGILRAHLEEDAGKNIHNEEENFSLVDLNRAGAPLLEIVSLPEIHSAIAAKRYVMSIREILRWINVCDGNMEQGSLRCEANISLALPNRPLGTRVEVKNMNSFQAVEEAISFEINRQRKLLSRNKKIRQETRGWDANKKETYIMRSKENAPDYRYFPEPDLPPFIPDKKLVKKLKKKIPLLPSQIRLKLKKDYLLNEYLAHTITSDRSVFNLFQNTVLLLDNKFSKPEAGALIAKWISGEILRNIDLNNLSSDNLSISPENLKGLILLLENKEINENTGKKVLAEMLKTGDSATQIVSQKNLKQVSNENIILQAIKDVLSENPAAVQDYQNGKKSAIGFLMGMVMKKTEGKADPHLARKLLKENLA